MNKLYKYLLLIIIGALITGEILSCKASSIKKEEGEGKTQASLLAGSWYPADALALKNLISGLLSSTPKIELPSPPIALIVPHAGYQFCGKCAAAGYRTLLGHHYKRVIILAPTHHIYIEGCILPDFDYYETPLGKIKIDKEVCLALQNEQGFKIVKEAYIKENSVEMVLPFLQYVEKEDYQIVPILIGEIRKEGYSGIADKLLHWIDEDTLIITSSDFTHYGPNYGYLPFKEKVKENLAKLDKGAIDKILKLDADGFYKYVEETQDTICGFKPIELLLFLLPPNTQAKLLNYSTSGEVTGDFTNSVSYASIAFMTTQNKLSNEEKKTLLSIARETLKLYLTTGKRLEVDEKKYNITTALKEDRGVFVTLTKKGKLRGCIGYIEGIKPLYQAVIDNAINAAVHDSRFYPVSAEELPDIEIEISAMTPLKRINNIEEIEVGTHGLVIVQGFARGVLLPQVATEYGWDRETFLQHVCLKAGLPPDSWKKEGVELYIFSAEVFGEH